MHYFGGTYFCASSYFDSYPCPAPVTSGLGRHVRGRHRNLDFVETPEPEPEDQTALIVLLTGRR